MPGRSAAHPRCPGYLSIRYTERLANASAVASVRSKGDSYDNALAESLHGLYKAELIRRHGTWRSVDDVELVTLDYPDGYNHRRLHTACGDLPPTEYEAVYYVGHNRLPLERKLTATQLTRPTLDSHLP